MSSRSLEPCPFSGIAIDLARFTFGQSRLGGVIASTDVLAAAILEHDVFVDEGSGIEAGAANGRFDYVLVTVSRFSGQFTKAGIPLNLSTETTEVEIQSLFGRPYWTDRSDGEAILFYEYRKGSIELQFEFSDGERLSHVTLAHNGVLSKGEQRAAYGVTQNWPPDDTD